MNEITAALCVLIAATGSALWSTLIFYLEMHGLTWVEMFLIAQLTTVICNCIAWIGMFSYQYYFGSHEMQETDVDTFFYNTIPPEDDKSDLETQNIETRYTNKKINLTNYLFSIFPWKSSRGMHSKKV